MADEWERGLALAKGEKKPGFWRLEWDRLGLACRFSSSGKLQGVTLVLRSVFDR